MHVEEGNAVLRPGQTALVSPGAVQWIGNIGQEDLVFPAICQSQWKEGDEVILK